MVQWKKIDGYNYSVSNTGNVRNDETGKILKPIDVGNGYFRVCLYKDKTGKQMSLHRVVAEAFVPNPEGKPEVNHIDGRPGNNAAENLEWCTRSENHIHRCHTLNHMTPIWAGLCKPVLCVETGKVYGSLEEAAKDVGSHRSNVSRAIQLNIRAAGFYWRWAQ